MSSQNFCFYFFLCPVRASGLLCRRICVLWGEKSRISRYFVSDDKFPCFLAESPDLGVFVRFRWFVRVDGLTKGLLTREMTRKEAQNTISILLKMVIVNIPACSRDIF